MTLDPVKERQEASLVGQILSLETALFLMGCASLAHGIINGVEVNIFFGVVIIPGVYILRKVRRKDWKKHWEDLEKEQQSHNDRMKTPEE